MTMICSKNKYSFMLPNGDNIDISHYLQQLNIESDDIVIVSGTLVEGIGNEFSDIDIYIITKEYKTPKHINIESFFRVISTTKEILTPDTDQDILLVHLPIEETGIKIDIEYKVFNDIDSLEKKLNDYYNYAMSNHILFTKEMSERQMSFIHRIHNCICLNNPEGLVSIQERLNKNKFCYFLYRSNASDYADLLDIIGAWRKKEFERCFDLARENVLKQMLAYICLLGNTDYKRKWILTRIEQSNVDENIKKQFISFYISNKNNINKYILDSLDFIDEIYQLSAKFFENNSNQIFPNRKYVLDWLNKRVNLLSKPYEIYEVEYRKKAYELLLHFKTRDFLEGKSL